MSWTAPVVCALSTLVVGLVAVVSEVEVRLPGNHKGYEPEQPIEFSHRVHAGELEMDCLACHYGAESSRHAGIPTADVCMGCHLHVTAGFDVWLQEKQAAEAEEREPKRIVSPALQELYDVLGLDAELKPDPAKEAQPIAWVRVHNLPDYVYFDHRVHVARGLACEQCHGPVRSMERVRQEEDLSMGWCVECHRTNPAEPEGGEEAPHVSIDCVRCHY